MLLPQRAMELSILSVSSRVGKQVACVCARAGDGPKIPPAYVTHELQIGLPGRAEEP